MYSDIVTVARSLIAVRISRQCRQSLSQPFLASLFVLLSVSPNRFRMRLLLALLLPLVVVAQIIPQLRTVQSTAVQGKLLCNGKPYEKARLKLYEVDPRECIFKGWLVVGQI